MKKAFSIYIYVENVGREIIVDTNSIGAPQKRKYFFEPNQNVNFSHIAIAILDFSLLLPIKFAFFQSYRKTYRNVEEQ